MGLPYVIHAYGQRYVSAVRSVWQPTPQEYAHRVAEHFLTVWRKARPAMRDARVLSFKVLSPTKIRVKWTSHAMWDDQPQYTWLFSSTPRHGEESWTVQHAEKGNPDKWQDQTVLSFGLDTNYGDLIEHH